MDSGDKIHRKGWKQRLEEWFHVQRSYHPATNQSSETTVPENAEVAYSRQDQAITDDGSLEDVLAPLIGNYFRSSRIGDVSTNLLEHELGGENFTRTSRVEQLETWDCGIACVLIIIRWVRGLQYPRHVKASMSEDEGELYRQLCHKIKSESVWTADLVLQLESLTEQLSSLKYIFCSKSFQVQDEYKDLGYYRDAFQQDEQRVGGIFERLQSGPNPSMKCFPNGISLRDMLNAVSHTGCLAIVLVDNAVLCARTGVPRQPYVGHFVVLCGISSRAEHLQEAKALGVDDESEVIDFCVVLCDPAPSRGHFFFVMPSRFDQSRVARGTDEDVIFFWNVPRKELTDK